MKAVRNFFLLCIGVISISCTTTPKKQKEVYWIRGTKAECTQVGKMQCLLVSKEEKLSANTQWEYFYEPIEGFVFEEGNLKQVEVEASPISSDKVPQDASSVTYKLVKEMKKIPDNFTLMQGEWILDTYMRSKLWEAFKNPPVPPTLEINLAEKRFFGNGGCNTYFGSIKVFSLTEIAFSPVASTQMLCNNNNMEGEYFQGLEKVVAYSLENNKLTLFDAEGKELFVYHRNPKAPDQALAGEWEVTHLGGTEIGKTVQHPSLKIDLAQRKVAGNDTCNTLTGGFSKLTDKDFVLGDLASTLMLCKDMAIADAYSNALQEVASYRIDEGKLFLFNKQGEEVLLFEKKN